MPAGLTASVLPRTTHSWKASFAKARLSPLFHKRYVLLSFSVKSGLGNWPTGSGPAFRKKRPSIGWLSKRQFPSCVIDGFLVTLSSVHPQDHWLRNQVVGNKGSAAASGPRLATVIRIRMSLGDAFAYSAKTSKSRFSLKTPGCGSSNPGHALL